MVVYHLIRNMVNIWSQLHEKKEQICVCTFHKKNVSEIFRHNEKISKYHKIKEISEKEPKIKFLES